MSALKFMQERPDLGWGRAETDGMPFRGQTAPLLKDAEADSRLQTVFDTFTQTFDLSKPEESAEYKHVLDMITNGWAKLVNRTFTTLKTTVTKDNTSTEYARHEVYIEWVVPVKEDFHPHDHIRGAQHG